MPSPKSFEENMDTLHRSIERSRSKHDWDDCGDEPEKPVCPRCKSKMVVEEITYCMCWDEKELEDFLNEKNN